MLPLRGAAQIGHEVYLITHTTKPGKFRGVHCLSLKTLQIPQLHSLNLDALVLILGIDPKNPLRSLLGPRCKLILWTGHADNQPGVAALIDPHIRNSFDAIALVSQWQAQRFQENFKIDPSRIGILRNAMSPAFAHLFPDDVPILKEKTSPPILAYTSTPFRGLNLLLDIFPRICARVPAARLQIFSSMKVYMTPEHEEAKNYGALDERCRQTEGVEYIGSVPQAELAQRLRQVAVLAYPNTFPETSCISVMEAMAAGCRVITSELVALPETSAGFASLIPVNIGGQEYSQRFITQTVSTLEEFDADPAKTEAQLRQQIAFANTHYTWQVRATEWAKWLSDLPHLRN